MQELTNDNYSDIKSYSIFHNEYRRSKAIEFIINKKNQLLHALSAISRGCLVIVPIWRIRE